MKESTPPRRLQARSFVKKFRRFAQARHHRQALGSVLNGTIILVLHVRESSYVGNDLLVQVSQVRSREDMCPVQVGEDHGFRVMKIRHVDRQRQRFSFGVKVVDGGCRLIFPIVPAVIGEADLGGIWAILLAEGVGVDLSIPIIMPAFIHAPALIFHGFNAGRKIVRAAEIKENRRGHFICAEAVLFIDSHAISDGYFDDEALAASGFPEMTR